MNRIKVLAAAGCLALVAACSSQGSDAPADAATDADIDTSAVLRYAASGGVTSFDPHKTRSQSDFVLLNLVYDRLVHQDVDGKAVPGLAESWEFSDDMTTLTFTLREGLTFADGSPLDAEAVAANIDRAREPDSISATQLTAIAEVTAVDATTVELQLNEPGVHLVLIFSDLAGMIVNPAAFADPEALATQPDGLGRFTLTSQEPGSKYVLAATEDYWDEDALKLAGMEVSVQLDPQTNLNALGSGQFECILVSPAMIEPAQQVPDAQVKARTVLTQTVLYPNQTKSEFGDPRVRRALNLAIDRDAVLQAAQEGKGEAAKGLFPEDYYVSNEPVADLLARDLDQARALLADAGLEDGFEFTALTLSIPQFVTTAEVVKDQLAEIGVTMNIKALPPADMGVNFLRGEGDASITGWTGRPDPTMLFAAYFDEESALNVSKAEPAGFAEALEAANALEDEAERGEALAEVQRIVLEDGGVVPLTFNDVGTACNSSVVGYEPTVVGISEFRGVGITK